MTKIKEYFFIGLLNLLFLGELIGLYFETINEGYTWIWFFLALILITLVNISITLGIRSKKK